jgi:hypothetical protein
MDGELLMVRVNLWFEIGFEDGATHIFNPDHPRYFEGRVARPPHSTGLLGLGLFLTDGEKEENAAYEKGFQSGVDKRFEEFRRLAPPLLG